MTARAPLALTLVLAACGAPTPEGPPDDTDAEDAPAARRRALVIGIDGLRPDGLTAAHTPVLDAWFAEGALVLDAQTQATSPTVSGPGWASILTGVETSRHAVIDNDTVTGRSADTPSFLQILTAQGHRTAVIAHWTGIPPLVGPDAGPVALAASDAAVGTQLAARLAADDDDCLFVHFDEVDGAGHGAGFSVDQPAYLAAIEGVDAALAATATWLDARTGEDWLVVMVTDHGGEGTGHGPRNDANIRIPQGVVAAGVSVTPPPQPSHLDVAPTVLHWLSDAPDLASFDGASWLP